MGYACPVCETPQADGRHLANHLAFTAMIHGDAHEAWLDDHAPDWADAGERELADRVVEHAAETELPRDVENATGESEGAAHEHGRGGGHANGHERGIGPGSIEEPRATSGDAERKGRPAVEPGVGFEGSEGDERDVAAVLAEARELTERMRDGEERDAGDGSERENGEHDGNEHGTRDENDR